MSLRKVLHFIGGVGSIMRLFPGAPRTVQLPYRQSRTTGEALFTDWHKVFTDLNNSCDTLLNEASPNQ